MAFCFMCLSSSSKMRKCRSRIRWLQPRHHNFPFLKIGLFSLACSLLVLAYLYFSELSAKTKLIDLALGSRSVEDMVKPNNDTLILNGILRKEKNPFVFIAVTSLPSNYYRREIIRSTWAKDAYENYGAAVVFFMGKPNSNDDEQMDNLIKESEQFGDLIIDDFYESYYGLSIKTLRIFKYFKFHHPKSKFLVKTDDDVFVNVQNLVHYCYMQNHEFEKKYRETWMEMENSDENDDQEIQHLSPPQKMFYYVGGVIHGDRGAHIWDVFSKWFAPRDVWKDVFDTVNKLKNGVSVKGSNINVIGESVEGLHENSYPPYAEGNFYILSDNAVRDILKVSVQLPLYHLEDVYVTGVLATWMLGIEKDNIPFISSASNFFPKLSYMWYKIFDAAPDELIAFHCDNSVELISTIYSDSNLIIKK